MRDIGAYVKIEEIGFGHMQEMKNAHETADKQAQGGGCKDSVLCGEEVSGSFYLWRRQIVNTGSHLRDAADPCDLHFLTVM